MRNAMNFSLTRELDRWTERGYDRPHGRIQPDTPPSRHKDSTVTPVTLGVRRGCALPVRFRAEDSPRGLWRSLGKRVGCKPSRVRIPHPPPGEKWALTCGNAVRSDRPGTSSHQISRPLVSVLVSVSGSRFARNTAFRRPGAFADVRLAQSTRCESGRCCVHPSQL